MEYGKQLENKIGACCKKAEWYISAYVLSKDTGEHHVECMDDSPDRPTVNSNIGH